MAGCVIGAVGVCAVVPWKLTAQEGKNEQEVKNDSERVKEERSLTRTSEGTSRERAARGEGEKLTLDGVLMTRSVTVRSGSEGMVVKVACKPGDSVKKGQELTSFDDSVARVGLMQAKATLEKDRAMVMRSQADKRMADVDVARANLAYDEAQLVLKEHEFAALSVKSPIDGVVSEMKVQEGEFVSKGAELLKVVLLKNPRVEVWVPGQAYPKLKVGQGVEFRTRAFEKVFRGKIAFVSPVADGQSGMIKVEADIDDADGELRPGLGGDVTVWVK
jgi:RND family efflux transporter MFP subunit